MLQLMHGGAAARPFVTHVNAFDMDLYLRIAPELFLKRPWSAAWNGSSRSTATSATRASTPRTTPEFTMLEAYQTYGDYDDMADADARPRPGARAGRVRHTVVVTRRAVEID